MYSLFSAQLFSYIAETRLVVVGDELLPGLFDFDEPAGNGLIERLRKEQRLVASSYMNIMNSPSVRMECNWLHATWCNWSLLWKTFILIIFWSSGTTKAFGNSGNRWELGPCRWGACPSASSEDSCAPATAPLHHAVPCNTYKVVPPSYKSVYKPH